MEQHDREELAEVNAARKGFYEFLASMYKLELTDEQIGTLTKQDLPTDAEYVGAGYATVKEYLRHRDSGTRQELAVDYARVFLCAGMYEQLMAPPYEAVYTSEELGLPADNTTPEDHLSFEFQFMAKLIERAGAALDAGDEARYAELCAKQRAFFDEHLANWVPRLCADVRAYAQTAFYRGVADITEGFLQLEDQMIGQSAQAA